MRLISKRDANRLAAQAERGRWSKELKAAAQRLNRALDAKQTLSECGAITETEQARLVTRIYTAGFDCGFSFTEMTKRGRRHTRVFIPGRRR